MPHLYRFFKGLVVLSIISLPLGGPSLFLMIIICSAGIGLIPLFPICYIVGTVTETIIWKAKSNQVSEESPSNDTLTLGEQNLVTNSQKSLMNNIWELKRRGSTKIQTKNALRELGWNDDEIDKAYDLCRKSLL